MPYCAMPLYLVDRQHESLGHRLRTVVHAVTPVRVDAVPRPDGDEVGEQRCTGDGDPGLGEANHGTVDDPGPRDEVVLVLGSARGPRRPRSGSDPHPLGLHERALAVVALVADVHDGVVIELHREVVPHAAEHEFPLADAIGLGLADRPHTPGAVPGPPAPVGGDGQVGAADRERPRPVPGLGQALGVEHDLALAAHVLAGLGDGGDVALPDDVHRNGVLRRLDHDAQPAQGLEHLDPDRPDREVAAVDQGRRRPDDVLGTAMTHVDEGVHDAEVRVLAVARRWRTSHPSTGAC